MKTNPSNDWENEVRKQLSDFETEYNPSDWADFEKNYLPQALPIAPKSTFWNNIASWRTMAVALLLSNMLLLAYLIWNVNTPRTITQTRIQHDTVYVEIPHRQHDTVLLPADGKRQVVYIYVDNSAANNAKQYAVQQPDTSSKLAEKTPDTVSKKAPALPLAENSIPVQHPKTIYDLDSLPTFSVRNNWWLTSDNLPQYILQRFDATHIPVKERNDTDVWIKMTITADGKLTQLQTMKCDSKAVEKELLKIINNIPQWRGGLQDDKKVDAALVFHFVVKMEKPNPFSKY